MRDAEKSNAPEDKTRKLQPAQETGKSNENKLLTNTAAIKGILKRPNEEISVDDQQSTVAEDNLDQTENTITSNVITDSNVEMFDADDSEQPFPSLTDEEKKIIGLTACPASGESRSDLKSPLSNSSTLSSCNNTSACIKSLGSNSSDKAVKLSYHEGDIKTTDAYMAIKVEEVEEDNSIERIIDSNVKVKEESAEMSVDSRPDCVGKSHCLAVTNEKSSKSDKSRKRKSVPLQISDEGCRDKTLLLGTTTKKRKSLQLPFFANNCSIDPLPVKSEEGSKAAKKNEGCINEETALQQFFMSTSKSTKSDHPKKSVLSISSQPLKVHKAVVHSPVKSEEKSPIKKSTKESVHHQPKRKHNLCETEINFFGPTKKALKTDKGEKQKKSNEKVSPVKTVKAHKREKKGTDKSKSIQKTEPKITTVTPITVFSSDESDMSSADNLDMNTEEHGLLKRIWDDFELPAQNDSFLEEDSQSPVKKQMHELPRKRILSTSKEASADKKPSMANALGLGKKQRIAHTSSHVSRAVFGVCMQTLF